ncbi:protoheme IX farnesyltransferase [Nitratireductor sp. CAU 1489]|uniref:Protoheme IX farnesyltransferase n=1 Tax=Nitratireductor arenosus TaxID=2682096 RepID=A0A844Q9Q5_9HYPH|nr:heme o synthase [Nitratireductor arenosus]MVA95965.1 protoheme IX farnesyltransferase [Nitratireductor arenosus]
MPVSHEPLGDERLLFGRATLKDLLALIKPRVMALAVFTALVGLLVAPGALPPVQVVVAICAIAIGAGGAGALNMWYDADIDAAMARTSQRPVPRGRIAPAAALALGLFLSVCGTLLLAAAANGLAAMLLAFTIFFYAVVYTIWLKRRTPQNIVIGGAAGALPPVIGWAAATGSVGADAVVLFMIIFLWTPPHFWALALLREHDYARAGIPMMPNVAGSASTRRQIFAYAVATALVGVLPWPLGFAGPAFGLGAAVLGAGFVRQAWLTLQPRQASGATRPERRLFAYSILYLFALFALLLADTLVIRALFAG